MISEAVQIALIATIAPTMLGIASVVVSWINRKDIKRVEHHTNSMREALVAGAFKTGQTEGHAAGVKAEKERARAVDEGC